MLVVNRRTDVRVWRANVESRHSIGFVPTMGALHSGHESLIEIARERCDRVAVSVFVNPTQFGPEEDFEQYPRTADEDAAKIERAGADLVWFGDTADIYPDGFATRVEVPALAAGLCGRQRKGHFAGVALVVLKLLHAVQPHCAFFGRKDYQQLVVIQRLVRDLDLDVEIVGCPTIREADGLARSSRNLRLGERGRRAAPVLYEGLRSAAHCFERGERRASTLVVAAARPMLDEARVALEYLELVHPTSLEPVDGDVTEDGAVLAVAAMVDGVRLIDNVTLGVTLPEWTVGGGFDG